MNDNKPLSEDKIVYRDDEVAGAVRWFRAILRRDKRMTPESKVRNIQALHNAFAGPLHDELLQIIREARKQFPEDPDCRVIYRVHDLIDPELAYRLLKEGEQ